MKRPHSILIIEDEESVARVARTRLSALGHSVDLAFDGKAGLAQALKGSYDLIVLDLYLPEMDGYEVLRLVRKNRVTSKVLILSARTSFDDRVKGLEEGADDYLSKPFDHRELALRVDRLLKGPGPADDITLGDTTLRRIAREVVRAGETASLTDREFELLDFLMTHPDEIIARDRLIKEVWKTDFPRDQNVVNVYLSYVRDKLERKGLPSPIETVHGKGVRFVTRGS